MDGTQGGSDRKVQAPPITISMHGLTRYLRVRVAIIDEQLQWKVPKTLLGVVPIGVRRVSVPIDEIQSIDMGRTVRAFPPIIGVALVGTPWLFVPWWAALLLAATGLWISFVALGPQLVVLTTSGRRHRASVCFGHQLDADLYMDVVKDLSALPTAG